jgi:hypothetical protein
VVRERASVASSAAVMVRYSSVPRSYFAMLLAAGVLAGCSGGSAGPSALPPGSGSPGSDSAGNGATNAGAGAAVSIGVIAAPGGAAGSAATTVAGRAAGEAPPVAGTTAAAAVAGAQAQPAAQGGSGGAAAPITMNSGKTSVIVSTNLMQPSDLAWNPYATDELWIMNHGDSSAAIVSSATSEARSVQRRLDPEAARHFMPSPNGFAFGARETTVIDAQGKMVEGTFATCPENREDYMGPTLWTPDPRIFAIAKSDREPPFNGPDTGAEGIGSHLDMLHRTPLCTGIAWGGAGNVYWTYSAAYSMFVKYDFGKDHGIGNADHSDGSVWRYAASGIGYVQNVPSHLAYAPDSGLLYMADTGNARIIALDPADATSSAMTARENVDGLRQALDMDGAQLKVLVASAYGLMKPSGLRLHAGQLYVSDNATGTIHKFTLSGEPIAKVQIAAVKAGALAGLNFGPDGLLYFVDMVDNRVLRLDEPF